MVFVAVSGFDAEGGMMSELRFISPTLGETSLEKIVDIIAGAVTEDPDDYHVIVGTDSKKHSSIILYVTVIILHRVGKGGKYFYTRKRSRIGQHSLKACVYQETSLTLSMAAVLEDALEKRGIHELEIQCHSDIGNNGKTKTLIKEVVSWISASGYTPHIKPDGFGASCVADRRKYSSSAHRHSPARPVGEMSSNVASTRCATYS